MEILYDNGYILQRKHESDYCGVDGDNWYLNEYSCDQYFHQFYNTYIDCAWERSDYVDCCCDVEYVQRYVKESQNLGIEFRILLCSTCQHYPLLGNQEFGNRGNILGYDCAYSGGSYYSCILNDILSGRIKEFHKIHLNENGLFASYKEAEEFMEYREKMKKTSDYDFEEGDFIIYKITEIEIPNEMDEISNHS